METDRELLDRVDEPECFERFLRRHVDVVHRYVARRLGSRDADEVTNDVFLTAYRQAGRFQSDAESARPWLLGIATNLMRNRRRSEARHLKHLATTGHDPVDPAAPQRDLDGLDPRLAASLARMRPRHREVLFLAAVAELTIPEIAEALDVPEGTVKTWLHRARARAVRDLTDSSVALDEVADTDGGLTCTSTTPSASSAAPCRGRPRISSTG